MRWIIVTILAISAIASADPAPTSDELKKQLGLGIDAFRLGKYPEARDHLAKARLLDRQLGTKSGEPYRYLALVSQAELKWEECIVFAREALQAQPTGKEVAETRKLHAACRASAGRAAFVGELGDTAAIAVTSNVALATVKVRGLVFGGTPITPRTVAPGRVAIDVEKGGYISVRLDIDVVPGIVTDVDVKLEQGEDTGAVALARKVGWISLPLELVFDQVLVDGVPVKVPPDRKIELGPGVHVVEVTAKGRDSWRRQIAITADNTTPLVPDLTDSTPRRARARMGYVLGTAGITLGVVGVFAFYTSRGASDEARRIAAVEIMRPIGDMSSPIRTRADFEDARSRAKKWALVSNLAYTAGLAAGGVGLYFILKGRAPAADEVPAVVIAPIDGGAMFARSGSW